MYGKIFNQMYDGTLVDDWQALVTFQQMIVLCDADGVIDMTPKAISNRTGIPMDLIVAGIEALEKPDQYSRTPDEEGRRITRIDDHRNWGWHIVNHEKYKSLKASKDVREQNRVRKQRQRERERDMRDNRDSGVTKGDKPQMSPHTDTTTDTDTNTNIPVVVVSTPKKPMEWVDYFVNKQGYTAAEAQTAKTIPMFDEWVKAEVTTDEASQAMDIATAQLNEKPNGPKFLNNFVFDLRKNKGKQKKSGRAKPTPRNFDKTDYREGAEEYGFATVEIPEDAEVI